MNLPRNEFLNNFREIEQKNLYWDLSNTVIMASMPAGLAYGAFGTWWHVGLFGFLGFAINAAGNRIAQILRMHRALDQANKLDDTE